MCGKNLIQSLRKLCTAVLGLSMIAAAPGCSKKVYVPIKSSSALTDTLWQKERIIIHDTIERKDIVRENRLDSISPLLDSTGRLIGYDRWHIIERISESGDHTIRRIAMTDSLRKSRISVDTVREPYTVEVIRKVNEIYWWQESLMWIGVISAIAFLLWMYFRNKKSR